MLATIFLFTEYSSRSSSSPHPVLHKHECMTNNQNQSNTTQDNKTQSFPIQAQNNITNHSLSLFTSFGYLASTLPQHQLHTYIHEQHTQLTHTLTGTHTTIIPNQPNITLPDHSKETPIRVNYSRIHTITRRYTRITNELNTHAH